MDGRGCGYDRGDYENSGVMALSREGGDLCQPRPTYSALSTIVFKMGYAFL